MFQSVKKEVNNQSCATTPSFWNSSARTPSSDISVNKTPHSKLVKAKSLREVVLSQSTTKTHPPVIPETPTDSLASTPPVKRLMSTLQDSLNWTKLSKNYFSYFSTETYVVSTQKNLLSTQNIC